MSSGGSQEKHQRWFRIWRFQDEINNIRVDVEFDCLRTWEGSPTERGLRFSVSHHRHVLPSSPFFGFLVNKSPGRPKLCDIYKMGQSDFFTDSVPGLGNAIKTRLATCVGLVWLVGVMSWCAELGVFWCAELVS